MAIASPAAEATVAASFTYAPSSPTSGETITFGSTSSTDCQFTTWFWDFGDGGFAEDTPTAEHRYDRPGDYRVRLSVWDTCGGPFQDELTVHVANRDPTASFVFDPSSPGTGTRVTFRSTARDPDGSIVEHVWDLDDDGAFDDASGQTAAHSFSRPGNHRVGLRVTDDHGGKGEAYLPVPVGNRPPSASFAHSPDPPLAGDTVTVFSTSTDPDGPIVEQTWDLDGDGAFDDASGATATQSFAVAGTNTVGLRVVDDDGVAAFASKRLEVLPRPGPASASGASGAQAQTLRLLNPFPVVRIIGTVTRRGVRLRRLLVDAPRGATVTVRCRGRRCPFRKRTRIASTRSPSLGATAARVIRFRRLERRLLRAGVRIKVMVTRPDAIGKFTFFRIRRGRSPLRVDRCLVPGLSDPVRCSAT